MKAATEYWLSNLDSFIFLLLILFLPTQLGRHFWPDWSFIFGQRIDYLSPTLYLTDILIGILFALSLIEKKIRFHPLFLLTILYISVTIFLSTSPLAGWYWLLKFLEMSFVGWYVVHKLQVSNSKSQKVFYWGLGFGIWNFLLYIFSIGILFESLLAFAQFIFHGSLGGLFYFLGERTFSSTTPGIANASIAGQLVLRPYATFPHPNVLAGYLGVGMLLVFYFFSKKKSKIRKNKELRMVQGKKSWLNTKYKILNTLLQKSNLQPTLIGLTLLIGTLGLAITLSRTAILAWMAIGLLELYLFLKKKNQYVFLLSLLLITTVFLLVLITFPTLFIRLFSFSLDESVVQRQQLALAAMQMILSHPLFGVGPNNFLSSLPLYAKDSFLIQPVHNIFLLIASETGLIGLGGVIGFLFVLLKRIYKYVIVRNAEQAPVSNSSFVSPRPALQVLHFIRHSERSEESHSKNNLESWNHLSHSHFRFLLYALFFIFLTGMFDHYWLTLQQGQLLLAVVLGLVWSSSSF